MAIDVVANDYHGKVVVRDTKDDGSAIILVCDEWDPSRPSAGPTVFPDPDERVQDEDNPPERVIYPLGVTASLGTLEIDVSDIPSGRSAFDSGRFCEAAVSVLLTGTRRIRLGPYEAEAFGFRARGSSSDTQVDA